MRMYARKDARGIKRKWILLPPNPRAPCSRCRRRKSRQEQLPLFRVHSDGVSNRAHCGSPGEAAPGPGDLEVTASNGGVPGCGERPLRGKALRHCILGIWRGRPRSSSAKDPLADKNVEGQEERAWQLGSPAALGGAVGTEARLWRRHA